MLTAVQANQRSGRGRASDSFMMLDLMRLPLGILTGMGFIGGGAILRRDGFVLGVTTAATLWFVTVVGLCFGGGQISLGIAASALGMLVLSGLRWFDYHRKQEQHGILYLTTERHQPSPEAIQATIQKRELEFKVQWRSAPHNMDEPAFLRDLASDPHVATALWKVS